MLKNIFLDYKKQIEQDSPLQVIERFYDDEISQVENTGTPIVGKNVLKELEINNLSKVNSVEIQITTWLVDEEQGLAMGEMVIHFDSKKAGPQVLVEAFLQRWRDGKIVFQKFYYK
ncbi:MAG: hypothetical protein JNL70_03410 [Saprospiraceae bacterium]|nr:hypothetical protein [Saprospiraceae bacterium]